jgi:hypothetical protein
MSLSHNLICSDMQSSVGTGFMTSAIQVSQEELIVVANVRFGSLADILPAKRDVRFTPKSGHSSPIDYREGYGRPLLIISWPQTGACIQHQPSLCHKVVRGDAR